MKILLLLLMITKVNGMEKRTEIDSHNVTVNLSDIVTLARQNVDDQKQPEADCCCEVKSKCSDHKIRMILILLTSGASLSTIITLIVHFLECR